VTIHDRDGGDEQHPGMTNQPRLAKCEDEGALPWSVAPTIAAERVERSPGAFAGICPNGIVRNGFEARYRQQELFVVVDAAWLALRANDIAFEKFSFRSIPATR